MSPTPLAQIKGGARSIKDIFFKRPTGSSLPTSSVAVRISFLRMVSHTLPSSQQNSFSYRTSLSTSAPTSQYILVSCWKNPPALKLQHSFSPSPNHTSLPTPLPQQIYPHCSHPESQPAFCRSSQHWVTLCPGSPSQ